MLGRKQTLQNVTLNDTALRVGWSNQQESIFHYLWLRDNCPQLRHPETNHRVIETSTIPDNVRPREAIITSEGDLKITWDHDEHVSCFTAAWLQAYDYSNGVRRIRQPRTLWDASMQDALPIFNYPDVLADERIEYDYLGQFHAYGLGFLRNVPQESETVLAVGRKFGEIRSTSWGTVFDVKAMVNANSVAYTNLPLVTHTDEAYRNPTPTVQFQHCLVSEVSGGESTLVDGFKVAADLREQAPEKFKLLAMTSLHFYYKETEAELDNDGPVIRLNVLGEVEEIRYSNHSVQPFLLPPDLIEPYYAAYRTFGRMRESKTYQIKFALQPGDLYMVDNRRILHGRSGFSSGGARHLQSCYIEYDELLSRLNVLRRRA